MNFIVVDSRSRVDKDVITWSGLDLSMIEYVLHCFYFAPRKTNCGRLSEYVLHTAAV